MSVIKLTTGIFESYNVSRQEYDKFVSEFYEDREDTDIRLTNAEEDIANNKSECNKLNDCFEIVYRDLGKVERKVKGLIISNIITAIAAVAGIILGFLI